MAPIIRRRVKREGWQGWDEYAPFYDWENAQTLGRRDVPFWRRVAAGRGRAGARARAAAPAASRCRSRAPASSWSASIGRRRCSSARARESRRSPTAPARQFARRLVRGDIRALPFEDGAFPMVLAPYGILQSLIRPRDLTATLASVARVLAPGGTFGIDLVPDVPNWREYENRVQLRGRARRRAADADRIGPAGSRSATSRRSSRRYVERRGTRDAGAPVRPDVPHAVGPADDAAARTRRVSRRRGARRLPRTAVGRARRCLDHHGEKEVTFRCGFVSFSRFSVEF